MYVCIYVCIVGMYLLFVGGSMREEGGDMEHDLCVLELCVHTVLTSSVSYTNTNIQYSNDNC